MKNLERGTDESFFVVFGLHSDFIVAEKFCSDSSEQAAAAFPVPRRQKRRWSATGFDVCAV